MTTDLARREDEARRLLEAAARSQDVDVDVLWAGIREQVSGRPRRRLAPAGLAVAAAAAVTVGVVGATVWGWGPRVAEPATPAGGGEPTVTLATSPVSPTPSAPPTTAPPTADEPARPVPTIPGNLALPRNQRWASYSPTSSGWHVEGKVTGLAKVHVRGEAVNLVLAPGVMVNENNRPAICEIYVPATQAINLTGEELGRYQSCSTLPWPGSNRARGGLMFSSPDGNVVDEWEGWVTMSVAAAPRVARVDYRVGGRTFRLQYRFFDPAWQGAYFMGFYPVQGDARGPGKPGDGLVTYYDKGGEVLAEEQLR